MAETEWDTLALDGLLTDTHGHLRNIDERALGTSDDHLLDIIIFLKRLLCVPTRRVTGQVELALDAAFERLANRHSGCCFQLVVSRILDDLPYILFVFRDCRRE